MQVSERTDKAQEMCRRADQATTLPRDDGWHVSDLVQCLRKSWYDRDPKYARSPTDEDRAYFLLGKSQHALLQGGSPRAEQRTRLVLPVGSARWPTEVIGTIDVLAPEIPVFEWPTEIKTTRSNDLKEPAYGMPHYIEQLAAYCIGEGVLTGTLAVWYIFAVPPTLRVWDITFGEQELDRFREELAYRLTVLSQNDTLPLVTEHREGECQSCRYFKKHGGPCAGSAEARTPFFLQANYSALGGDQRADLGRPGTRALDWTTLCEGRPDLG